MQFHFIQGASVVIADLQVNGYKVAKEIGGNTAFVPTDVSLRRMRARHARRV